MQKKRHRRNISGYILCALVFFAVGASVFCMIAESREAQKQKNEIEAQQYLEKEEKKVQAEKERADSFSAKPGVGVGTFVPDTGQKIVYLTFDDGPSENTGKILDILEQYDAKATFFITGSDEAYRPLIGKAYQEGHTIGLHTYSHDYAEIYSSADAYFKDLEKIGKVAKEQIGFVPCFIRFPGGTSNGVSANYCKGIMSVLASEVQKRGYQYYDWNVDSGDGAGKGKDEIIAGASTDTYSQVMILFHDSRTKTATVEALPSVIRYYQNLGYQFRAIDRTSFVSQHVVQN